MYHLTTWCVLWGRCAVPSFDLEDRSKSSWTSLKSIFALLDHLTMELSSWRRRRLVFLPNSQTNSVIVHHELSLLFWYLINTIACYLLGPTRAFISFYYRAPWVWLYCQTEVQFLPTQSPKFYTSAIVYGLLYLMIKKNNKEQIWVLVVIILGT